MCGMFRPHRVIAVAVVLAAFGSSARAERLAITNVHSEPDVADEAGAVTLLVRTALAGNDRTLLEAPTGLTVAGAGAVIAKVGADHALLMELGREGLRLRITLAIVGTEGEPDVSLVRAGDGDIQGLAKGVVDRVTTVLHLEPGKISEAPLGRLRPYVSAMRFRPLDPKAAASALAYATPSTVFAVPAAAAALHGLPASQTDPPLALLAARAIGDAAELDTIGKPASEPGADAGIKVVDTTAIAARVFAAIARTNLRAADAELAVKKLPKASMLTLVSATLAELHGDDKRMNDLLLEGLATDQQAAILALGSTIVPARLIPVTQRALLNAADKVAAAAPGVVSRIGLGSAQAGIDVPRGLALVSVRELDDYEIKRLEPLIKGNDATSLRLRAELALRRGDGSEAVAITEYGQAADDPRSHRYLGWLLMGKDQPKEAALEFAKAGLRREQSHALLVANDIKGALAAIEGTPTSAEELIIQSRMALANGKLDDAAASIALAEKSAPISPVVQAAVIDLAVKRPDPARAMMAKLLVERGTGKTVTTKIETNVGSAAPAIGVTTKQLGSAATKAPIAEADAAADAALLAPMLAAFSELSQMHRISVAELEGQPSFASLRTTHPAIVQRALRHALAAAPYELQVTAQSRTLDADSIDAATVSRLMGDADGVLLYRVQAGDVDPNVTLMLYTRGATEGKQLARTLPIAGVIGWNVGKVTMLALVILGLVGALVVWITRATGTVKVIVDRASDVSDDTLCIEITKRASRPPVPDLQAFYTATRKAGSITKPRLATLIASNSQFQVPAGTWYVHLYGTFSRGGTLRPVPETCTQQLTVKRGSTIEVKLDLTSKLAEVTVHIESEARGGVAVWPNDDQRAKVYTDPEGDALLILPVGNHTIHIDAHGTLLSKPLQIVAPKLQLLTINLKREMRFMNDVVLNTDGHHDARDLELAPSAPVKKQPMKISFDDVAKPLKNAATMAMSGSEMKPTAQPGIPVPGDILLGRYRIKAELGRGAMGVVHHAWDEKLEREVAIKEMADDLRKIPEAMQLFVQEAKALAQLNHTNIVAMYDQITEVDKVYMIMEFVDGQPLEAIVRERGALQWLEAVGIMDQACAGLSYAHARKVIHRDIKPANIFVANDKIVKLGDFGLARVMREVTIRSTEIRGTPLYMAPEQIRGTDVDHRADLYAVGCTLFELCTGRPPFIEGDILFAQMNAKPPSPAAINASLPKPLDELILSLLEKSADDRPGSANEVRATFRDLSSF
ncbi:MAG: hypothetical protein JWO36_6569 [Myxococcales bacterium]|nr:hypothetical protein [Myxococcales bacterium]